MQSTIFCSLAGDGLLYGCYQIYPENAETCSLCSDCKEKDPNFFS